MPVTLNHPNNLISVYYFISKSKSYLFILVCLLEIENSMSSSKFLPTLFHTLPFKFISQSQKRNFNVLSHFRASISQTSVDSANESVKVTSCIRFLIVINPAYNTQRLSSVTELNTNIHGSSYKITVLVKTVSISHHNLGNDS